MSAQNPNLLILSRAAYGATVAATYQFMTKEFQPPAQPRYIAQDIVKNQNGKFKWIYDNGPGFKVWAPFVIKCENAFANLGLGSATQQLSNLRTLWEHPGLLGMEAPDGNVYNVHWSDSNLEQNFRIFPRKVGDDMEYEVTVQFEEG